MVVNLRGGLGNQALQISFALNNSENILINDPYNVMHECFDDIYHLQKISSKILWYTYAGLRKLIRPKNDAGFISLFGIYDGYFHKDTFSFHPAVLEKVCEWCGCYQMEVLNPITVHFRGGDYLAPKVRKLYENIDLSQVLSEVNTERVQVQVISNDIQSATHYFQNIPGDFIIESTSLKGDLCSMINSSIFIGVNSTLSALVCAIRIDLERGDSYLPSKWFVTKFTPKLNEVKIY